MNPSAARQFGLVILVAAALVVASESPVKGQVEAAIEADEELSLPEQTSGFQVPVSEEAVTALGDFQRYVARRDWQRAFRVLEDLDPEKRSGMLPGKDGWHVPAGEQLWEEMVSLPAEGRAAFRVFYNAKAKALYEDALTARERPNTQMEEVFRDYFLTDVGDEAADWLANDAFQRGDFFSAATYWERILNHYSESDLSEPLLLTKRATALALGGRRRESERILRQLEQRFEGQTVRVGAGMVPAASIVREALAAAGAVSADSPDHKTGPVALPADNSRPVWVVPFLSPAGQAAMAEAVASNIWNHGGIETYVPDVACTSHRLYCNWLGVCFAVDRATGKLLWRTGPFKEVYQRFESLQQRQILIENFQILAEGDAVYVVRVAPDQYDRWPIQFRLERLDPETGKQLWSTGSGGLTETFTNQNVMGSPTLHAGTLYVISHGQGHTELQLHAIEPASGTVQWSLKLGTMQMVADQAGNQRHPLPTLMGIRTSLFVLTENGALLEVDIPRRELVSLLKFEGPRLADSSGQRIWYGNTEMEETTALHVRNSFIHRDGILYCKEAGSRVLFALDPLTRRVLWKRPIDRAAMLVGIDDTTLYAMSRELMAIDRETHSLKWANTLPIQGAGLSLVSGDDTLLVMTGRGMFQLSRKTGDRIGTFRGDSLDSIGGRLVEWDHQLLNVSNLAITLYPPGDSAAGDSGG